MTEPPQRALATAQTQSLAFVGAADHLVSKSRFDCSQGLPSQPREYGPSPIRALAIQPGDRLLACADNQGKLQIWEWRNRVRLRHWRGHDQAITSLAADPDGARFASGSEDGSIKIWDWQTGNLIKKLEPNMGRISALAWSSDGQRLAALGESGAEVWQYESGDVLGKIIAQEDQRPIALAVGLDVIAVAWSPGGIEIWNSTLTARQSKLRGHTAQVTALAFSADGKKLASAGNDGALRRVGRRRAMRMRP